jgi:DNA gyrase inhibitor GyrI
MKKVVSIVLTTIVVFVVLAVAVYIYYGGLTTIVFNQKEQGGEILVYKEIVGDYSNSGEISEKIYYQMLNDFGVDSAKLVSGFGIFYDNPNEVPAEECRSKIGCVLDAADVDKIPSLESEFIVKTFPKGIYTSVDFPYKGMLSIYVGMINFYRALQVLKDDNSKLYKEGPIMEIYNMQDGIITYRICGIDIVEALDGIKEQTAKQE